MVENPSGIFPVLSIPEAALSAYREGKAAMNEQQYHEATAAFTRALEAGEAEEALPLLFSTRAYEQRGICHWLLGEYDAARADFEKVLASSDDQNQIARTRTHLGDVADSCGEYDKAMAYYRAALQEGLALNDLNTIGLAHRGMGIVNRRRGDTEKAISHLTQALAACRQAGSAVEQGRVLTSLGRAHQARGEYQQAISAHREALTILEALNQRWRMVLSLNDLGECFQALYAIPQALEAHRRALQLAEEHVHGINIIKPDIQRNLGVDLVESGRVEEGLAYLRQSVLGAENMGNREQVALGLYHLARAYVQQERLEEAQDTVRRLSALAEAVDVDRYRALCAFVNGELLFARGRQKEAAAQLNEAMLAAQTSVDRGVLWKLHAVMSHVTDNEALAKVHGQIAADFVRQTAEPLLDSTLKESFLNAAPVVAVLQSANIDPSRL